MTHPQLTLTSDIYIYIFFSFLLVLICPPPVPQLYGSTTVNLNRWPKKIENATSSDLVMNCAVVVKGNGSHYL